MRFVSKSRFPTTALTPLVLLLPFRSLVHPPNNAAGLLPLHLAAADAGAGLGDQCCVQTESWGGEMGAGKHVSPFLNEYSEQSVPIAPVFIHHLSILTVFYYALACE